MKVIVGIGNHGRRYQGTRHNVGFDVIDLVARKYNVRVSRRRFLSLTGQVQIGHETVHLLKPQTYVNETGQALRQALDWFKLVGADVLVVCDDVNLPLGCGRARRGGSSGGHGGLQSVIDQLGTEEFSRLRVGIGSEGDVPRIDYVLSRFAPEEREIVEETSRLAAEVVDVWVVEGIEACMNRFNSIGQ